MKIVKQYDIASLHFDIESQYTVTTKKTTKNYDPISLHSGILGEGTNFVKFQHYIIETCKLTNTSWS